jgi:hypothetical protein
LRAGDQVVIVKNKWNGLCLNRCWAIEAHRL